MIALFCGSRDWCDSTAIFDELENAWKTAQEEFRATKRSDLWILHGAAPGADTIAGITAIWMGFTVHSYPADWARYGKPAGILRNKQMLDQEPDRVYAFILNSSPGTSHTISEAVQRGIPITIIER
jgi:hypothetical protein